MFKILGTGMYLPERQVTNQYFIDRFGADPLANVFDRIGHGCRFYAGPNESAADLAIEAGRRALKASNLSPSALDLLIVATDTPSQLSPATSAEVQHRLEAKNAGAFDINCACAGFVTGLDIAARYLATHEDITHALIVGTYAMSKFLDPDDGVATPLFGDGAAAFVVVKDSSKKKYASTLRADGQYWDYMGIYAGGSRIPITHEVLDDPKRLHTVKIPKKYPSTLNLDHWPPLVESTLKKVGLRPEQIDMFIFTQIRKNTIIDVMSHWNLPLSRTHTVMEKWGYTGSACVPMALHDAVGQGKAARGQQIVLCASGGGYSMACVTFEY